MPISSYRAGAVAGNGPRDAGNGGARVDGAALKLAMPRRRQAQPRLLERTGELRVLAAAARDAAVGAGGVVVVEALPGLGKTSLLEAGAAFARDEGMIVLSSRGTRLEGDLPFGVVRQILEGSPRGAQPADVAKTLASGTRLLQALRPSGAPAATGSTGRSEIALIHAIYGTVSKLSGDQPVALVVDDLHWADAPSTQLMVYLAQRATDLPLLLLAGIRPSEPGADQDLLRELQTAPGVQLVRPKLLSAAATEALLDAERASLSESAPAFTKACHAVTGGNPLLLRELLRTVAAEGWSATDGDVVHVHDAAPAPVRRSVALTLLRLPPPATALARAVAVLGDDAEPRLAARFARLRADKVGAAAAALQRAGLFKGTELLGFSQPILRQAVYTDIPPGERALRHREAAYLLHIAAHPQDSAIQLLRAPPAGEQWAVQTLREAGRGPDTAAAVRFLRRALLEPPADAELPTVLAETAHAECTEGASTAGATLRSAIGAASDPDGRATLLLALSRVHHSRGEFVDAARASEEALEEVGPDHELAQELEAAWAAASLRTRAPVGEVRARLVRALDRAGDAGGRRMLLAHLAGVELATGESSTRAVAHARRAWDNGRLLAEVAPDDPALHGVIAALQHAGSLDEARAVVASTLEQARKGTSAPRAASCLAIRGGVLLHQGLLERSQADLEEALDCWNGSGPNPHVPRAVEALVTVLIERDDLEGAEALLAVLPQHAETLSGMPLWASIHLARGRLAIAKGDAPTAVVELKAAGELAAGGDGTANPAIVPWRSECARALRHVGKTEEGIRLVDDELCDAERWSAPGPVGHAMWVRGLLAGAASGLPWLRSAVEVLADSGAQLEHARALVTLGAALRATGKRRGAQGVLRRGLDVSEACGARAVAGHARQELAVAGGRPRSAPPAGREGLTPGERRVTELVAQGRTNREIATELFVTVKAVRFHLGNIYRKLGVQDRAQIAAAVNNR